MLGKSNQDQHFVLLSTHVHLDINLLCINNQIETTNGYSTVLTMAFLSKQNNKSHTSIKRGELETISPQP